MGRSNRLNPTKQIQVAPDAVEQYVLVSDPADGGQYKHQKLAAVNSANEAVPTTATSPVSNGEHAANSKTFVIDRPSTKHVAGKVISDINGKFNTGTVNTVSVNAVDPTKIDVTVTDFTDECLEGDEIGILIFWKYDPN
jgi:hypothetical protein